MSFEPALVQFVRRLLSGGIGKRTGEDFATADGRRALATDVLELVRLGVLVGDDREVHRSAGTASWLKRAKLEAPDFAARHRLTKTMPDGAILNLAESPLSRLAAGDAAFLGRHHVEAGERVRRLVERAQLQPRLTMSYSDSRAAGRNQPGAGDITDMAADARRAIDEIHRLLPRDCAGVVVDVCGLLKGLQEVERDRGWPRRSAKLVLRIGLEQLAQHYGLGPFAVGRASAGTRNWMEDGARPERFE